MRPQRLCFFNSNRPWGGGEHWHSQQALFARDRGYTVSVVAASGGELAKRLRGEPGIRLLELPLGSLSFLNPLTLSRLAAFFRAESVEAVILCLPRDVKAGGLAAKLAGVPKIIYRRGIAVPVRDRMLNRLLFSRVLTGLIVNSEETRRCVLADNPGLMEPSRIHLVYNGFDVAEFDARQAGPLVPRRAGELVIGTAGRLTEQKGQRLLIDAAAIMKSHGERCRVLIAGTGELEAELKARAVERGVADMVEFLGFVRDMKAFHASIDIFALPSLWEGFGFVLAEAMSMRLPVAAFDVSSVPEVVAHGETGLLCRPDAGLLAANMQTLLHDGDLRRRMGEAGRARVLERFELGRTFGAFERCLES
jgi:glycosyltransferase involved in cell wall biosynthesis